MECELVKLGNFSGEQTSIYSVLIVDENKTLFDKFIEENTTEYKLEINNIVQRLHTIGKKTGAREHFFKINEGAPGDGVCALYDDPNSKLRLYCIRYGNDIVILGGGGFKPKTIRALQQDKKLETENYFLRDLSKEITQRLKDKDITKPDFKDFEGDLTFNFDDYEN
ncbi:hypothetical protein AB3G33_10440 [Flavobacterium sp. WC2421]|uniref:hypothetical protein n=1 Tax=Flavobacterium sp. WC2421 TaxID=3234138 RepID=UPI003466FDFF